MLYYFAFFFCRYSSMAAAAFLPAPMARHMRHTPYGVELKKCGKTSGIAVESGEHLFYTALITG